MRVIPEVLIKGTVLSVTEKKTDNEGKALEKPYRLFTLAVIGNQGDAKTIELKSYGSYRAEVGKSIECKASVSCWAMKGRQGDVISGMSVTIIEPVANIKAA